VTGISLELDPLHPAALEGMLEEQQLCLDVGARAPRRAAEPGPADLDPAVLREVVQVAGGSDGVGADADGKGDVSRRSQGLVEVPVEVPWPGHETEDLEPRLRSSAQAFTMPLVEQLDRDDPPGERPVGPHD